MSASRPFVGVFKVDGSKAQDQVKLPSVLVAPIRQDIVHFVHTQMNKNRRQAYAVSENAGHQHSAESWGTGRAVARIPRVSGGGTSRAGQAAFGNQCRKGRMFAPTKIWRKWHRKINVNQKRYAVASALAASALPSLVLARGHRVEAIPEVPLVLEDAAQGVSKTRAAIKVLQAVGAYADVEKAAASRKLRRGVGKSRNRRHTMRRGPLVVFNQDNGITRAFRNLPGVELCHVDRLNLLQLAPGGHLGRFVIWTKSALQRLDKVWGSTTEVSAAKKDYTLPRAPMTQTDLSRLINSDEVQSKLNAAKKNVSRPRQKKNPLTNLGALVRLNPYALSLRRAELLAQQRQQKARAVAAEAKKKGTKLAVNKQEQAQRAAIKKHNSKNKTQNYKFITRFADDAAPSKPLFILPEEGKPIVEQAAPAPAAKPAAAPAPAAAKPAAAPAKPAAAAAKPADKPAAGKDAKPAGKDAKPAAGKDAKPAGKDAKAPKKA